MMHGVFFFLKGVTDALRRKTMANDDEFHFFVSAFSNL